MPDIGLSSANEACDVKSLRGIQYLHDGQRLPKRKTVENGMGGRGCFRFWYAQPKNLQLGLTSVPSSTEL